ncbi:MAG: chromosome segregation ATPase [Cyanobacteria bacterium J06626_18]
MSRSNKFPRRDSGRPVPPPPPPRSPAHDWGSVPPPGREQRPRTSRQSLQPEWPSRSPFAATATPGEAAAVAEAPKKGRFLTSWTLWGFLLLALISGIGGASAVSLFRIPNLPNCRAIFWPTASAATRLQCADAYADEGSVENLLAAIALVEALPEDHPLRPDINTRVEMWADQILNVADQTFQQGDLDDAINIAKRIPGNTAAANVVSDRIAAWQNTWEQAESIFKKAENHIKASEFREAFSAAIQLRSVANEHWSTTRYDELTSLITRTREDVNILADAERQASWGTVEDILEALEKVAAISSESYVHAEAQQVMKSISRQLLDLAEDALARADSDEARDILSKIPPEADLSEEVADFRTLADAYELIWAGTTSGYESAIVRLQSVGSDRPLYSRAQELKQQWQAELEAVAQLNWAKQVARPGSPASLRAAIAEAQKISSANPLSGEAQDQIQRWREDIALIEDRPYLDRAEILANRGDRTALEAAIQEAQIIPSNSPLYGEAQDAVGDWRWQIQTMDNEPILAQARQFADLGRLDDAIAVASQIPQNQAFYDEAQTAIFAWETEQNASASYQEALLVSRPGTVAALVTAIAVAQTIPEDATDWSAAQESINRWSWTLLDMAETAAGRDVSQGIEIAEQVPSRTEAYAEAQLRLREWQVSFTSSPSE